MVNLIGRPRDHHIRWDINIPDSQSSSGCHSLGAKGDRRVETQGFGDDSVKQGLRLCTFICLIFKGDIDFFAELLLV